MATKNERRSAAGRAAVVSHGVTKHGGGKKGRRPTPDRPLMDRLDEVADAISDILHYAQLSGLITSKAEGGDLAMRAVRNFRAE